MTVRVHYIGFSISICGKVAGSQDVNVFKDRKMYVRCKNDFV